MAVIAILTPTRGRPQALLDMLGSIISTAERGVRIYIATDDDDRSYDDLFIDTPIRWVKGPRKRLAGWTNELARLAIDDGADILGFFGDDHRPRTWAWDTRVADAFDLMGPGLVYAADGLQNERLPTAPFWPAHIVDTLGWFYPPVLQHLYADNYWLRLANDLDRRTYLPDVLIEHMHPSAGKGEMDDVYRENDTHYDTDRAAFERFVIEEHPAILERIRAVI